MAPVGSDQDALRWRLLSASSELNARVDETMADRLLGYVALLEKWNRVHSLSAWSKPLDLLVQHVFDSMTLVGPLRRFGAGRGMRILDAGSGPGFPAAVLAIMEPTWLVTAVDAVAKKVAFVRQSAAELAINNLVACHGRLEDLAPTNRFDVITSRAFGSLKDLIACTSHLLAPTGVWVAQKGRIPQQEIDQLKGAVDVFHVEPVTVPGLEAERCLVWMRPATP